MKTFDELTPKQQETALTVALNQVLVDVVGGGLSFASPQLNDLLDKAVDEAQEMQTPWFIHEYIMDEPRLVTAINGLARAYAAQAMYAAPSDPEVIWGIIE